jgi:HSP20 family molecular chaperone IbpA
VVVPNAVHTSYKNGVLEIKLKKAPKERALNKKSWKANAP